MDWKLVRKIGRDLVRMERIDYDRCDVLTLAHDNDRHLRLGDKYYSPLINTLEDRLAKRGVRCLSVARIISTIKGDAAFGDVRSPEGAFARALVAKRLKGVLFRGTYPYSRMEERIWGRILDTTAAKKVVGIQPSRELCVAARKRGVWVADMQHGVIAETHPWYGESFRAHEPPEYLPHGFLVWDPGSAEVLEWTGRHGADVMVIGNPWLSRFLAPADDDWLVAELIRAADGAFARDGRKNILVSLSWGDKDIPNGLMTKELETAIRETRTDFNWHLRMHPNQVKGFASHESEWFHKYYAQALKGFASWEDATRNPLPLVLSRMDLHVTWTSSVCIEAAHFGIQSALLNPRLQNAGRNGDYYRYYKGRGAIHMVDNDPVAIRAWLVGHRDVPKHPEDYARYNAECERLVSFLAGGQQA